VFNQKYLDLPDQYQKYGVSAEPFPTKLVLSEEYDAVLVRI
jgi:hypothetical protein